MIKHVVCFKLAENNENAKKEAKEILLSMKGKVPQILDITVGTDFLCSARSYDVFLMVALDDKKALDDYQNDEYHCGVVKTYMHSHTTASVALDFEE